MKLKESGVLETVLYLDCGSGYRIYLLKINRWYAIKAGFYSKYILKFLLTYLREKESEHTCTHTGRGEQRERDRHHSTLSVSPTQNSIS